MNALYDQALRGIGTVAVAHTILDMGCHTLLSRLVQAGMVRAKPHLTVGGKLELLKKKKVAHDPRLIPVAPRLIAWIGEAERANEERNRIIHDAMFYGDAAVFPGLVQMREGKAQLVDPKQLEALRQRLTVLAQAGMLLAAEVAIQLDQEIEPEEEDEGAKPENVP